MGRRRLYVPLKLRLFFPIALIIISVTAVVTALFITSSIKSLNHQIENNLKLEVKTISKMFERERQLKLEKVKTNLKVAHNQFYSLKLDLRQGMLPVLAKNQITGQTHTDLIENWILNGKKLQDNFAFVDGIKDLLGGTATIFQKIDSGYIRVSTNVQNSDGSRAVYTFIPNSSPVVQAVEKGEIYYGRAYVVNDWYITAYEPIFIEQKIAGILYVGNKEKDLQKLREILYSLKIGESGYTAVFDKDGQILIHPTIEGENWKGTDLFNRITEGNQDILHYRFQGKEKTAAFTYYPEFEFYILASVETEKENRVFIRNTILNSTLIALITIIILLSFLYFLTADRIHKYFVQLDVSKRNLLTAKEALKQSEDRFQKLFNSTADDIFVTDIEENIVEVNQASCSSLGYTREELLGMKMSDIKTDRFARNVSENRKRIYEQGILTFESENVAKDGKVIPVEITARVVEYNNEKLILSVVRNVGLRKETEREILSTVIRTEERERERFAKDMHDSVGPLLSTIKLYINELKSSTLAEEERKEFVKISNEILDESITSIRTISNNLMPRVIHKYGLIKALESFCEKVNKTNTINIKLSASNFGGRVDQNLELILFRVVTELITNTLKHAKAKKINIELEKSDNKILLNFKDDGIGFDINKIMNTEHLGMGLKNIISRIKSINGDYNFITFPDNGFEIKVNIDL